MKKYFLLLFLLPITALLYNCTSQSKASGKVKLPKALPSIPEDSIYSSEVVINFLFDNEEKDTDSAHQASKILFLQGIDLYKNKKKYQEAIPSFKKSILLFPSAKTYNELGNLLFETANYDECIKAYSVAIDLGYSPLGDTYFNMTCAIVQSKSSKSIYESLEYAFKNGFRDSLRFVTDPRLQAIRSEYYYENFLSTNFGEQSKNKSKSNNIKYNLFIKEFTSLEIPFAITSENVGEYNANSFISYDYSDYVQEMENVSFGRDVSNEFCHVGILKQTDHYTAVLYSSVEMMGGNYGPVYTMIATYNPKGDLIAKKVFACRYSAEKIKTGQYDGNIITMEEQKVNWEKDFSSEDPEGNKILGYETIETTRYAIDDIGNINPVTGS